MVPCLSFTYRHLEPSRLYEALHSMRRVCSCNPPWVMDYHESRGWGPFGDRPCGCGCPWRRGHYRPSWPWGVIDNVGPEYGYPVRPMDHFRAVGYPDDLEIVNNPYRIGFFIGVPSLRIQGILFPASASWPILRCQGPGFVLGRALALPHGGGHVAGGPRRPIGGAHHWP